MVETVTESDYAKHTVSELKEELKSKGLKVSGNKSELISRLVADLNETIQNLENVIEETEGPRFVWFPILFPSYFQ